jgi:hypothetical protein
MHAYARPPRRTASKCRPARNRSSPAISRCAHPAYACLCSLDEAPRNPPEKLASLTSARTRKRWSGACALCTRRADQRFDGGGGSGPSSDHRVQTRRSRWSRHLPYAAARAVALLNVVCRVLSPEKLKAGGAHSRPEAPHARGSSAVSLLAACSWPLLGDDEPPHAVGCLGDRVNSTNLF